MHYSFSRNSTEYYNAFDTSLTATEIKIEVSRAGGTRTVKYCCSEGKVYTINSCAIHLEGVPSTEITISRGRALIDSFTLRSRLTLVRLLNLTLPAVDKNLVCVTSKIDTPFNSDNPLF